MTASLYQSGSSASVGAAKNDSARSSCSIVVIARAPVAGCAPGACRGRARYAGRRVPTSRGRPRAGRSHLDGAARVEAERAVVQPKRAGAPGVGIEADDRQHGVAPIGGLLGVREQRVVVDVVEHEPLVRLQGRVLAADPVDLADQRREGVGRARGPRLRISYFSEFRYSSLPGSRGTCSSSSNAGP